MGVTTTEATVGVASRPVSGGGWRAVVSQGRQGGVHAVTVSEPGLTRMALWEAARDASGPDSESAAVHRLVRACPLERIVAACSRLTVSITVADLGEDGRARVVGHAAPSVLRTAPERAELVPVPLGGSRPVDLRVDPGGLLVLCSPTYLDEPPEALRRTEADGDCVPDPARDVWDWALDGLLAAEVSGAVAVAHLTRGGATTRTRRPPLARRHDTTSSRHGRRHR